MLDIPTEENTMTFTKFAVAAAAALLCAGSVIAAPVEGTDYVVLEKSNRTSFPRAVFACAFSKFPRKTPCRTRV